MRNYIIHYYIFQGPAKTQPPPSAHCLQARQLQHTADMLEGVLYVDRLAPGAGRRSKKGGDFKIEFLEPKLRRTSQKSLVYGFFIFVPT